MTLEVLAEDPRRVAELAPAECAAMTVRCAALLAVLGVRLQEIATAPTALIPPLDLAAAAPLFGMKPETLRLAAKKDPGVRACVFNNGTDRLLFDAEKVAAFRRRRTGE